MLERPESSDALPDMRHIREALGLSQAEFAALLGFSPRAVQSVEQGWRRASPAFEKAALLLLLAEKSGAGLSRQCCWRVNQCPPRRRNMCLAYRSRQGHLCWFLTGTLCGDKRLGSWQEKRALCAQCPFFQSLLKGITGVGDETTRG